MVESVDWVGASGKRYTYEIYTISANFNNVAGNYIFAKRDSQRRWIPIYIGETSGFKDRFSSHHKATCISRNGATHVHAHINPIEQDRLNEEADLIAKYNPPCNG